MPTHPFFPAILQGVAQREKPSAIFFYTRCACSFWSIRSSGWLQFLPILRKGTTEFCSYSAPPLLSQCCSAFSASWYFAKDLAFPHFPKAEGLLIFPTAIPLSRKFAIPMGGEIPSPRPDRSISMRRRKKPTAPS